MGSVDYGEDGTQRPPLPAFACGRALGRRSGYAQGPRAARGFQRTCLMRAVSSCTRLYTERSSLIRRAIFEVAWMTVVWSRPPNSLPILGSEESVSSRDRYIATCLG